MPLGLWDCNPPGQGRESGGAISLTKSIAHSAIARRPADACHRDCIGIHSVMLSSIRATVLKGGIKETLGLLLRIAAIGTGTASSNDPKINAIMFVCVQIFVILGFCTYFRGETTPLP